MGRAVAKQAQCSRTHFIPAAESDSTIFTTRISSRRVNGWRISIASPTFRSDKNFVPSLPCRVVPELMMRPLPRVRVGSAGAAAAGAASAAPPGAADPAWLAACGARGGAVPDAAAAETAGRGAPAPPAAEPTSSGRGRLFPTARAALDLHAWHGAQAWCRWRAQASRE